MFAVLKTGGKQYKVQAGDMLRVERIAASAGETVQFNEVLMLGGDNPTGWRPDDRRRRRASRSRRPDQRRKSNPLRLTSPS